MDLRNRELDRTRDSGSRLWLIEAQTRERNRKDRHNHHCSEDPLLEPGVRFEDNDCVLDSLAVLALH
jgi:hypothetical protein